MRCPECGEGGRFITHHPHCSQTSDTIRIAHDRHVGEFVANWRKKKMTDHVGTNQQPSRSIANGSLPTASEARKAIPITTGCLDYFPLALAYVAKISYAGNKKHNPGQPLHWNRNKSTDHADCIGRHLVERGTVDPEDKLLHDGKLAWRSLANLQEFLEAEIKAGRDPFA
jgi:hypothetical protein